MGTYSSMENNMKYEMFLKTPKPFQTTGCDSVIVFFLCKLSGMWTSQMILMYVQEK